MKNIKRVFGFVLSILLISGQWFLPVASAEETKEFEGETVIVGVVSDTGLELWEYVAEKALEEEGITLELVLFNDYNQPNVALQNGSLDMSGFQGHPFIKSWNEDNDGSVYAIANTLLMPLGLYSEKHATPDDIPEGGSIALPNDPSTLGRSLLALEIAGLIEVDDEVGIYADEEDITANPKNLEMVLVEPNFAALSLPDVDAALINTNFANDVGLSINDAIFNDAEDVDKVNPMYINTITTLEENKDNPLYLKIAEIYQTDDVEEKIHEVYNGETYPMFDVPLPEVEN
ncbi:MetQ/NlpA family ABC transporter substrate-binding protein [Ruoffia sp. FAM 20857]